MVYTFGLARNANIRYRDSMIRLSRFELNTMLHALGIDCELSTESFGGADFLSFDCRPLSGRELTWLSGHSSVFFLAEKEGSMLHPLSFESGSYLEEDLPEILKYKGKTSASFLRLMINTALSITPFLFFASPLTMLDPVCGKGTACFCAVQAGFNAIGLDIDRKAIQEASDFFSRYLKYHLLKHSASALSETVGKTSLAVKEFVFADSKEHYQQNFTRFLRFASGDTALVPALCRHKPVHIIVADLPYGIQHAPCSGSRPESFRSLLSRALPSWKQCLLPGGAIALSFNTLTFPRREVLDIVRSAGLAPYENEYTDFLVHEVEHAVKRDIVLITN